MASVRLAVESGSNFGSQEYRRSKAWAATQHQSVRYRQIDENSAVSVQLHDCRWEDAQNGSQAGIYYFVDKSNYIKLVKEKLSRGVFIVMAYQIDDKPYVCGKCAVKQSGASTRLRMQYDCASKRMRAYFKEEGGSDAHDQELKVGISWKNDAGDHYHPDDAEAQETAFAPIPGVSYDQTKFRVMSEQWREEDEATISVAFNLLHQE